MNFEEFENKARLYVVGALEAEEFDEFAERRRQFGERAEAFINECRKLNSVFALSLRPHAPKPETRARLLEQIRETMKENGFSGAAHD
ncbi:MAG: hypothetical protein QOD99_860 [Chthoniobacter sp.]|jgi:anti-sigma-K factor RskA|nr:hypothetical protein [Chthoniobacter sp.]